MHSWIRRTLACASAIVCLAQDDPLFAQIPDVPPKPGAESVKVEDLLTTDWERLGSSLSVIYALSDVADDKATATPGDYTRNPDDRLWKSTLTVKGSAIFRTVTEVNAAFTTAAAYKAVTGATNLTVPTVEADSLDHLVRFFSRTRKRDRIARFFSGMTLSGSLLERAETDFGTPALAPALDDRTKGNIDATFDPSSLFLTPNDKTLAFKAAAAYLALSPDAAKGLRMDGGCEKATSDRNAASAETRRACWRALAGLSGWKKSLFASLIPTFKFETIDEFDYAVVGGQPILFPESFKEGALQNYTFTWNLLKIIKPADAKVQSVAALKALEELVDFAASLKEPLAIKTTAVDAADGFFAKQLEASVAGAEWAAADPEKWTVTGVYLTKDGMLVGMPRCKTAPCVVYVSVRDKAGRSSSAEVAVAGVKG